MDILKTLFPLSFKKTGSVADLIVGILIYLVVGIVAGFLLGLAGLLGGWIPVAGAILGWVLRLVGTVVEVYVIGGIVILALVYAKVIEK